MPKQREGVELDLWREAKEQKRLLSEYFGKGYLGEYVKFHRNWKEYKELNDEEDKKYGKRNKLARTRRKRFGKRTSKLRKIAEFKI
jgi:hypothetical protein